MRLAFRLILALLLLFPLHAEAQFSAAFNTTVTMDLGPSNAGNYAPMNMMKSCNNWASGTANFGFPAFLVDSYPNGTLPSSINCTMSSLPTTAETGGSWNWVFEWPATGGNQVASISWSRSGHTFTTVSNTSGCTVTGSGTNSYAISGTNCRVVFSDTGTGGLAYTLQANASTFTNFNNLILVRTDQESELLAGSGSHCSLGICFYPDFLAVQSSKFGTAPAGVSLNEKTVRFINWNLAVNGVDDNNLTRWALLQDVNAFSYASSFYWSTPNWGGFVCSSSTTGNCSGIGSGTANQYVGASIAGGPTGCQDGFTYQGIIGPADANTTASPTFTANGCTATITDINAGTLSNGNIANGAFATLTYNLALNEWVWTSQGLRGGWPVLAMVALCNVLNTNCWIQVPHQFDPTSAASLATLVAQNLNVGLKFKIEGTNEVFNFGNPQTNYFTALGVKQGFPSGNNRQTFGPYMIWRQGIMLAAQAAWLAAGRKASDLEMMATVQVPASNTQIENFQFLCEDCTTDASGNYTTGSGGSGQPVVLNYSNATVGGVPSSGYPAQTTITKLGYAPYINGAQIAFGSGLVSVCASGNLWSSCGYGNDMTAALAAADNCGNAVVTTTPPFCTGTPAQIAAALSFINGDYYAGTRTVSGTTKLGNGTLKALFDTSVGGNGWFAQWDTLATKYSTSLGGSVGGTITGVDLYEGGPQNIAPTAATLTSLAASGSYTTCDGGNATGCANEFANLILAHRYSGMMAQLVQDEITAFKSYKSSGSAAFFQEGSGSDQWSAIPLPDIYATPYGSYFGVSNSAVLH